MEQGELEGHQSGQRVAVLGTGQIVLLHRMIVYTVLSVHVYTHKNVLWLRVVRYCFCTSDVEIMLPIACLTFI